MRDVFEQIYQENFWRSDESASGTGSDLDQTKTIREILPQLFKELHVKKVFDIPCGDFNWFKEMNVDVDYIGADVVPELVKWNYEQYADEQHTFRVIDITHDPLPDVDLILCRDLLGHFSNRDVQLALRNIKSTKAQFLLATTFPGRENPTDIETGQWRPINLASLFGLPNPERVISESCPISGFEDKSLGLWRLHA